MRMKSPEKLAEYPFYGLINHYLGGKMIFSFLKMFDFSTDKIDDHLSTRTGPGALIYWLIVCTGPGVQISALILIGCLTLMQ